MTSLLHRSHEGGNQLAPFSVGRMPTFSLLAEQWTDRIESNAAAFSYLTQVVVALAQHNRFQNGGTCLKSWYNVYIMQENRSEVTQCGIWGASG